MAAASGRPARRPLHTGCRGAASRIRRPAAREESVSGASCARLRGRGGALRVCQPGLTLRQDAGVGWQVVGFSEESDHGAPELGDCVRCCVIAVQKKRDNPIVSSKSKSTNCNGWSACCLPVRTVSSRGGTDGLAEIHDRANKSQCRVHRRLFHGAKRCKQRVRGDALLRSLGTNVRLFLFHERTPTPLAHATYLATFKDDLD